MNNRLLKNYNSSLYRLNIILLLVVIIYIFLNSFFQYHEKKQIFNNQVSQVAKAIRNDLIRGNQYYVYEQCRSLVSDLSIEKLVVTRNDEVYCNLKSDSNELLAININVPVLYNPETAIEKENIVGQISLQMKLNDVFLNSFLSLAFFLVFVYIMYKFQKNINQDIKNNIVKPINQLAEVMRNDSHNYKKVKNLIAHINSDDIKILFDSYLKLGQEIEEVQKHIVQQSKLTAFLDVSKQVAHDIRSPLSALNMIMSNSSDFNLTDKERIIARNAIQRINDIANDLLLRGREDSLTNNHKLKEVINLELIPTLVEMLVSEKRIQYRQYTNVIIEVEMRNSFGAFSFVNAVELRRALSNLINNAVESLDEMNGKVLVKIEMDEKNIYLSISDNGKGIPEHLIDKVMMPGFSFDKNIINGKGSGLGLSHAQNTIHSIGGSFSIKSLEKKGTTISIILNNAQPPDWFSKEINLSNIKNVISVDDDSSIHQIWGKRLSEPDYVDVKHNFFQSIEFFKSYVEDNKNLLKETLFLIDYEFINQNSRGLDIIEEFDLAGQSILVTNNYEEENILLRAKKINLKILPKLLAGFVPFLKITSDSKYEIVLLDDDELTRSVWELRAERSNKKALILSESSHLWMHISNFDKETLFYIDVNLAGGESGLDVTKKLFDLGYQNLYLATGYDKDDLSHITWIKGVVGKGFVI